MNGTTSVIMSQIGQVHFHQKRATSRASLLIRNQLIACYKLKISCVFFIISAATVVSNIAFDKQFIMFAQWKRLSCQCGKQSKKNYKSRFFFSFSIAEKWLWYTITQRFDIRVSMIKIPFNVKCNANFFFKAVWIYTMRRPRFDVRIFRELSLELFVFCFHSFVCLRNTHDFDDGVETREEHNHHFHELELSNFVKRFMT